jgi:hypothetical protein
MENSIWLSGEQSVAPVHTRTYRSGMITGRQIRAGRSLLGWGHERLAEAAGVSEASVRRAEYYETEPHMRVTTIAAIERALLTAGIVFLAAGQIANGGEGVRLRGAGE